MDPLQALAILGAGLAAGTINTIVGSGSLITFPTLLAFGYSPVVANVSNTVGLVPGSASGAVGYRRELVGQRGRCLRLGLVALGGGICGGLLLLVLPSAAFDHIVPFLLLIAVGLVIVQPRLSRYVAARARAGGGAGDGGVVLGLTVFATAVYGGYFGAGQGVLLISLLAIFLSDTLQRLNALKNVLAALVNGVAAVLFILVAHVAWLPALFLALGSIVGGQVGAGIGRRLPPIVLRSLIVVIGTTVAVKLLIG
ncbi:MAG TPA: sulfite exporter TauE/SafE family protein [Candidatus Limnocylindrales bacterium]|nr:sulfite exporter TauE/SafE family protein [Candidatus Limnocylindrales bacterium]